MTEPATPQNSRPLLDLNGLLVAIRRRRRFWLSLGLLGFLLGAAAAVLLPPAPTAVTRLLVVHENDSPSDGGSLMETDIALLETTRIAAATLDRLGPEASGLPPTAFLESYEATGLTSNVMEVAVQGTTEQAAIVRAKALADTFITDHRERARAAADAEVQALRDQQAQAQRELREVDAAITAATDVFDGDESAAEMESLYARRAELASKVSDLGSRAEEAGIGTPWVIEGTQVVDAPRPVPGSPAGTMVTNSGLGLVLGLVAGLSLAAVSSVVRDRAVLRRDVSEHLGASVIAQISAPRKGPSRLWRRSHAATEQEQVAVTLARLVGRNGPDVSLLELGCARTAAELAETVNRELDGACAVRVGSVAPGAAWTDLATLGSETIVVVRAGQPENAWLHTVARQLADAEIQIIGVVLVDPDPRDRTDGTLWDGLHTALRGRARTAVPGDVDLPTKRFAPVQPQSNGNVQSPHDGELPTKRFAPLTPGSQD